MCVNIFYGIFKLLIEIFILELTELSMCKYWSNITFVNIIPKLEINIQKAFSITTFKAINLFFNFYALNLKSLQFMLLY